jgi:DNA-binding response OmpR family regulator
VLLVDDDESLRLALASELEASGFGCERRSTRGSLRETDNRTFDVAIVDLNLPAMSGEELFASCARGLPRPKS